MVDAASPTSSHQLHWWKSPRWTVIRIEALVVVAIIISFFLAAFGSNRWITRKGFSAAKVLSLTLGTYSFGLMQSPCVKSQMYPIWTVSLFTLFGCIDPVTTYNIVADYKGPYRKTVYGVIHNCGYVMLMSISTISNVGNAAIITLSVITLIKSFHRTLALVVQNKLFMVDSDFTGDAHIFLRGERHCIATYLEVSTRNDKVKWWLSPCYDSYVALCLSHKLRRYFVGLDYSVPDSLIVLKDMDMKWALKVIEIELAFVYDAFFTGRPFLHYYHVRTASLWAIASFAGICFVLIATATPGGVTRHSGATGCTQVVGTMTADFAITSGILVSLALLQLTQLVQSWTSNWARASIFCTYIRKHEEIFRGPYSESLRWGHLKLTGWMRLKVLVATSTNLFDKYLWQEKMDQYSLLPEPKFRERKGEQKCRSSAKGEKIGRACVNFVKMLGLDYIWLVTLELFSRDINKRGAARLDEDVKGSVIDFLGQIQSDRLDRNWLSSLPDEPLIRYFLPQFSAPQLLRREENCYRYISCVMTWHIATWFCEQKSKEDDALMSKQAEAPICCGSSCYLRKAAAAILRAGNYFKKTKRGKEGEGEGGTMKTRVDHRRVANVLSQYCFYLVRSAPELLPGPVEWVKRVYYHFAHDAWVDTNTIHGNMPDYIFCNYWEPKKMDAAYMAHNRILNGMALAKLLMHGRSSDELWKTLARVWVQLLLYAAPYGNAQAHIRHLSQGGEFITHLWAMLYHLDIHEWKVPEVNNLHHISTVEDAQRILNDDDHCLDIVVLFAKSDYLENTHDDFVTASKLVDGVEFFLTSSRDVAKCLYFPESVLKERVTPSILFLNKADHKITVYDPTKARRPYTPWDIAQFAYENKLASANKARAQESAPSTGHNPIPIEKQRSEDGQTVVEITEDTPPPS